MALHPRLRRIAPFVAAGLVVPVAWAAVVLSVPDAWVSAAREQVLQGAPFIAISTLAGALMIGFVLGLPRRVRPLLPDVDVPAATAGTLAGVLLGSALAVQAGAANAFYPDVGEVLLPATMTFVLWAMGAVGAVWTRPLVLPSGGRTATVAGLALSLAPPVALLLLWEGTLTARHALEAGAPVLATVGTLALAGVAAARYLTLTWARRLAAVAVVGAVLFLGITQLELIAVLLPTSLLALAIARDLWDPPLRLAAEAA